MLEALAKKTKKKTFESSSPRVATRGRSRDGTMARTAHEWGF